jgi:predicted dehydrogenase
MRFGLIGAGGMGRHQAGLLARVPGAALAAIGDVELPPAARALAEQHGAALAGSAEAVLARPDVDAVIIATPTGTHAPLALAAIEAGKHVFVEKPIARTLAQAEQMISAAERAGVKLAVGHVVRYFPEYAAARDMVRRGEVGTPGVARVTRLTGMPRAPWYADTAVSGGVILDVMIHDFDWLLWTFGPVARVAARGLLQHAATDRDAAMAVLRFGDGTIGYAEGSWHYRQFRTSFEVSGSGGLIRSDNNSVLTHNYQLELPEGVRSLWPDGLEESPYLVQIRDITNWFAGGPAPRHSAADGLEALRVALAALESVQTGRTISLEVQA